MGETGDDEYPQIACSHPITMNPSRSCPKKKVEIIIDIRTGPEPAGALAIFNTVMYGNFGTAARSSR